MKHLIWLLAFFASVPAITPAYAGDNGGSSSAGSGAHNFLTVAPSNSFGYALTSDVARAALAKDANQNLLLSPVSAATALQMLLNGAGSSTYTEMATALRLQTEKIDDINTGNRSLLDYFTSLSTAPTTPVMPGQPAEVPFTLALANSIWGNSASGFQFKPEFVSTLQKSYDAVAQSLRFDAAGAGTINQWASDHTNGKITHIVDVSTLQFSSFVLMNATYFKANWLNPFQVGSTRQADFTNGDGSRATVDMMQDPEARGYSEVAGNQVMELPYEGLSTSMYVVLPAAGRKIADVLADTTGPLTEGFWTNVEQATEERADFSLPKFKFDNALDLSSSLQALGMKTLFTPNADLTGTGSPNVAVSSVLQDTYINVDEFGTEAAAVTAISAGSAMPSPIIHVMNVNRPFVIAIVEKTSHSVLFVGEVSKP